MEQFESIDTAVMPKNSSVKLFSSSMDVRRAKSQILAVFFQLVRSRHELATERGRCTVTGTRCVRCVSSSDQKKEPGTGQRNLTYAASESMKLAFDGCNRASPGAGSILKAQRMAATKMKPCRSAKYLPGQFLQMREDDKGREGQ